MAKKDGSVNELKKIKLLTLAITLLLFFTGIFDFLESFYSDPLTRLCWSILTFVILLIMIKTFILDEKK